MGCFHDLPYFDVCVKLPKVNVICGGNRKLVFDVGFT